MNKRFFTLMAAVMLAGSPFAATVAFADDTQSTQQTPTVPQVEEIAASGDLYSGMQFYLKSGNDYLKVTNDEDGLSAVSTTSDFKKAAVFEVRNYANGTFTLNVANEPVNLNGKTVFYAADSNGKLKTTADFVQIYTFSVGTAGTPLCDGTVSAKTTAIKWDAAALNANLSGNGFKLSFPGVAVQPDVNPFASQMIAVDANTIATTLGKSYTATQGEFPVMFVLADEAGKKAAAAPTDGDKVKAATFVVLNPNANFGITGLTATGEGYDFTTVKGEKLADANKKSKGEIDIYNAAFVVAENDQLNGADELAIKVTPVVIVNGQDTRAGQVNVGVYSLTTGGVKSYVTTVTDANANKLTQASVGGNTYVAAADLLSTSKEASIYNIFFQGNDGSQGKAWSYYGKYLVAYATDTIAAAPGKVNTKLAEAQWVVTDVQNKGVVELKNVYNGYTVSFKLYKTETAGVYQAAFMNWPTDPANIKPVGAGIVKLVAAKEEGSFLKLTDSQLAREAGIVFGGEGAVTVSKIYPYFKKGGTAADPTYTIKATSDADAAATWTFKASSEIEHALSFAYLKDNQLVTDKAKCKVPTYNVIKAGSELGIEGLGNTILAKAVDDAATNWKKYAFRINPNGTYTMYEVNADNNAPGNTDLTYDDVVAGKTVNVNISDENLQAGGTISAYNTISIDFAELGESLPAVSRHATFEGIDGGISMLADAKGILNAVVTSQPLTFWLDTAESKAETPKFYISKGIATEEETETKAAEAETRLFLYTPSDSTSYWDANKAQYVENKNYYNAIGDLKAIFRPAALVAVDTIATLQGNKEVLVSKKAKSGVCVSGLSKFQFAITKSGEDYVITNDADKYLYNLNGVLGFTADSNKAMLVTVGEGDPTANEAIAAEAGVQVIGGQGVVTVQGAAGKVVTVANILGQTIANQVATSDNVTIAVPAGIVVVSVDGEATKVVVK